MPSSSSIRFDANTKVEDLIVSEDVLEMCSLPCCVQLMHFDEKNNCVKCPRRIKQSFHIVTEAIFFSMIQFELNEITEKKSIINFEYIVEDITVDLTNVTEETTIEQILCQYEEMKIAPYSCMNSLHTVPFDATLFGYCKQTEELLFTSHLTFRGYARVSKEKTFLSTAHLAFLDAVESFMSVSPSTADALTDLADAGHDVLEDFIYCIVLKPSICDTRHMTPNTSVVEIIQQYQDFIKWMIGKSEFIVHIHAIHPRAISIRPFTSTPIIATEGTSNTSNTMVLESIQEVIVETLTRCGLTYHPLWNVKFLDWMKQALTKKCKDTQIIQSMQSLQFYLVFESSK